MHDAGDGDVERDDSEVKNDKSGIMDDSQIQGKVTETSQNVDEIDDDNLDDPKADKVPGFILFKPQIGNFGIMILSLGVVIGAAVIRGGDGFKSLIGLDSCSFPSFVILIGSQVLNFTLSRFALNKNRTKIQKYEIVDLGIVDSTTNFIVVSKRKNFFALCYVSGIAAGLLGIGGGMILGPFMLNLGFEPQYATALAGFIVVFTSSSTSSQFSIAGAIHLRHAGWFMFTSLLGSLSGTIILKKLVKHYKKPSILVWVVFSILSHRLLRPPGPNDL
jgi:uncharacterized membrane protein YfcA